MSCDFFLIDPYWFYLYYYLGWYLNEYERFFYSTIIYMHNFIKKLKVNTKDKLLHIYHDNKDDFLFPYLDVFHRMLYLHIFLLIVFLLNLLSSKSFYVFSIFYFYCSFTPLLCLLNVCNSVSSVIYLPAAFVFFSFFFESSESAYNRSNDSLFRATLAASTSLA